MRALHRLTTACVLTVAGFAFSACTPPGQVESPHKVDTAVGPTITSPTTLPASAIPGYIDCIGAPTVRPTSLSLRCSDDALLMADITWESWDATRATGTGTLVSRMPGFPEERLENAAIELFDPFAAPLGLSFTRVKVNNTLQQP
ncbi:hypothetical protein QVA66_03165 [Staphylococcus chromogenes]|nr:hypothetical protein [Staphylococcus chromogenes]